MGVPVVLAFGANLGEPLRQFHDARKRLTPWLVVDRESPIYRSAPMYLSDQPSFLNGVWLATTELDPYALLRLLKETEAAIGRTTGERNGPRLIDLDLIVYGALIYRRDDVLQVPHPRLHERRFVLQPWADLDSDAIVPGVGRVSDLLLGVRDQLLEPIINE